MILNKFPRPVLPPPPTSSIPYNYPNVVVYPDVNNDYEMRRKIAKYFYEIRACFTFKKLVHLKQESFPRFLLRTYSPLPPLARNG